MKKLIPIFCLVLIFGACKKSGVKPGQSQGIITGYDLRKCASPMCGGILINIENDTAKNPPPFYHINGTLAQLGISEDAKLPINVSLNYKPDTGILATYHYIVVTNMTVVN